jgi:hypothetical protein
VSPFLPCRASVTGGGGWDEAAGVPGDGAPEDPAAVSAVAASPTPQEVAAASSPQPAVLDSDVVRLKGLQIKCAKPFISALDKSADGTEIFRG